MACSRPNASLLASSAADRAWLRAQAGSSPAAPALACPAATAAGISSEVKACGHGGLDGCTQMFLSRHLQRAIATNQIGMVCKLAAENSFHMAKAEKHTSGHLHTACKLAHCNDSAVM